MSSTEAPVAAASESAANPEAPATTPSEPAADPEAPKIVLYWLEQSRAQRILWLLEELNLSYELRTFRRGKTMLAPPELKKIHPLGKSPVIGITPPGATEPTIIAESGLIVEYLLSHYGKSTTLLPPQWRDGQEDRICGETPQWMRYKYFLHYAEGSLMSLLVLALVLLNIKVNSPFFIRPIASRIASKVQEAFLDENFETHFAFLEDQLRTAPDGGGYLCGPHLTAADILLSFPLLAAKNRLPGLKKNKYPLLWEYIEKLEQEQGYKKAANKIMETEGRFLASL